MADGCIERLDAEFVLWLVWEGRTRSRRKRLEEICRDYAKKAVVVRSRTSRNSFSAASPNRRLRTEPAKRAGIPWSFPWHFGLSDACPARADATIGHRETKNASRAAGRRRRTPKGERGTRQRAGAHPRQRGSRPQPLPHGARLPAHRGQHRAGAVRAHEGAEHGGAHPATPVLGVLARRGRGHARDRSTRWWGSAPTT